jgi:hypothetical protein
VKVGDVVVDGAFFSGGGGSSAWSGNRSFVFSLAAPTSLLFAVSATASHRAVFFARRDFMCCR